MSSQSRTSELVMRVAIVLLTTTLPHRHLASSQELEEPFSWTSNGAVSFATPDHTSSTYNSLSDELAAHQHSRFNVQLKQGYDLLDIILTLFDWKEQDTDQLWIRPVEHVDREKYDTTTSAGMEATLMTFIRKARHATDDEAIGQLADPSNPVDQQTKEAVLNALDRLQSSGELTSHGGINTISWRRPREYKVDLKGDVNVLRKALLVALQNSPGIAYAQMDDQFLHKHKPAWYEVSAEPWDVESAIHG